MQLGIHPSVVVPTPAGGQKAPWTPLVVVTGVATTIGSAVPLGYQLSVINSPAEIIREWCHASVSTRYGHVMTSDQLNVLWTTIVSIFMVGGFVAPLAGSRIADRFGRKFSVVLINMLGLVAAILFVTSRYANSVEMLLLARFIVGLAGGLTLSIVPMYLTEIGQVSQRGVLGTMNCVGIAVGMLLGQVLGIGSALGSEFLWNYLLATYGIFVLLSSLAMPYLPESPKYLYVIKGDREACIKELSAIRGLPVESLTEELNDLETNHQTETKHRGNHTFLSVARSPAFHLPLLLVVMLQAAVNLSGIDALFFYSTDLFKSIGLSAAVSEYATLGLGFIEVVMSLVAVFVNNNFGRRPVLFTSIALILLFEILLTITLKYADAYPWLAYACIVNVLGIDVAFCIGLAHIPQFIANELFVVGPASVAMAYTSLCFWLMEGVVGMTFPAMRQALDHLVFLPYVAITVFVGAFSWFFLPETKDRLPQDIADRLKHGLKSKIKDVPEIQLQPIQNGHEMYRKTLS